MNDDVMVMQNVLATALHFCGIIALISSIERVDEVSL